MFLATLLTTPGWSQADEYGQPITPNPGYASQSGDGRYEAPAPAYGQNAPVVSPAQPLDAGRLEQLVAPIALYPDALLAQVLAASTYPNQVVEADRWRQAQGYAPPEQIAAGADMQSWDPSVKALTAFPQVLAQMDRSLQWTADLGNAYFNQPQDLMEAVQVMRRRAQEAGTLRSGPQEVVRDDQGVIALAPPDPQVVYVPAYNPWAVYGEPVTPYPGFNLLDAIGSIGSFLGGGPLRWGLGIAMSAFSHTPWGWLAWGLDWLGHELLFNHSDYCTQSRTVADWGFAHDGLHAYAGHSYGFGHNGYGRGGFGGALERGSNRGYDQGTRGYHQAFNRGLDHRAFENRSGNYRDNNMRDAGRRFESPRQMARVEPYHGTSGGVFGRGTYGGFSNGFSRRESAGRSPGFGAEAYRGNAYSRNSYSGQNFSRSSANASGKSHEFHLFGGGHSQKSFGGGHSGGLFGGGKGSHGSHNFSGGKAFGGGGHSHGGSHGGGHSGGHGGGKHH